MNTVFARALLGLTLVALPATALGSTKPAPSTHSHSRGLAKKEAAPKKKGKHHAHKANTNKGLAAPATPKAP